MPLSVKLIFAIPSSIPGYSHAASVDFCLLCLAFGFSLF